MCVCSEISAMTSVFGWAPQHVCIYIMFTETATASDARGCPLLLIVPPRRYVCVSSAPLADVRWWIALFFGITRHRFICSLLCSPGECSPNYVDRCYEAALQKNVSCFFKEFNKVNPLGKAPPPLVAATNDHQFHSLLIKTVIFNMLKC